MGDAPDRTLDLPAAGPARREKPRAEPHLVVAFECGRPLSASSRHRLGQGGRVVLGRGAARTATRGGDYRALALDVRVPDPRMSSTHALLDGALGRWTLRDQGSRNGVRVNGLSVSEHPLASGDLIELGHTLFLYEEAAHGEGPDDVDVALLTPRSTGLVTLVSEVADDFARLEKVAAAHLPVLVLGETGTGKEVVARALHELSGRPGKFVAVNSGALPATLLESELFGSAKGAFSGSVTDRVGLVRSADRGTLFLDEIGDLPLPSQAAFLRVLQERMVRPVGGADPIPVDLRLVCATNRDVEALVREGTFRADLFGRIAGFRLTLPPLRERRADLGILIASLVRRAAGDRAGKVTFTVEAARAIFAYRFPLNVRELDNWLQAAVTLAGDTPISPDHLPDPVDLGGDAGLPESESLDGPPRPLTPEQEQHREEIVAMLRAAGGNVSAVARSTGKGRNQVQRWLKRYGLNPDDYR